VLTLVPADSVPLSPDGPYFRLLDSRFAMAYFENCWSSQAEYSLHFLLMQRPESLRLTTDRLLHRHCRRFELLV